MSIVLAAQSWISGTNRRIESLAILGVRRDFYQLSGPWSQMEGSSSLSACLTQIPLDSTTSTFQPSSLSHPRAPVSAQPGTGKRSLPHDGDLRHKRNGGKAGTKSLPLSRFPFTLSHTFGGRTQWGNSRKLAECPRAQGAIRASSGGLEQPTGWAPGLHPPGEHSLSWRW